MSATIDTNVFTEYFFTMTNGEKIFPVVVDISENRKYNLITSFLDGLKNRIPEVSKNLILLIVQSRMKKNFLSFKFLMSLK